MTEPGTSSAHLLFLRLFLRSLWRRTVTSITSIQPCEDNVLAAQPKSFVTTDSDHGLEVYLNLAWRMKLTGVNQLWVADITYIRLHREWLFVAVILDAYSRRVMGWELDRTLAAADGGGGEGGGGSHPVARCGASFRPRHSVRFRRLRRIAAPRRHDSEHEPAGEPL